MKLTRRKENGTEQAIANQDHSRNLSSAAAEEDRVDPEYIDKMTGSDLDSATVNMLSNMLSRDWVLANLTEAEVNEERWLARTILLRVEALHPRDDAILQGDLRQYCYGDRDARLSALSAQQRAIIFQFLQGHISRVTRGRDGWQQDKFNESLTVSERRDGSSDDGGGWL